MVREDILGGLKAALERGHSLQSAVETFLNAGYDPREINEALAVLHSSGMVSSSNVPQKIKKVDDSRKNSGVSAGQVSRTPSRAQVAQSTASQPVQQASIQRVSSYLPEQEQAKPSESSPQSSFSNVKDSEKLSSSEKPTSNSPTKPVQRVSSYGHAVSESSSSIAPVEQRVSAYPSKKEGKGLLIALVIALLFLTGLLATVLIFKDELVKLLSR